MYIQSLAELKKVYGGKAYRKADIIVYQKCPYSEPLVIKNRHGKISELAEPS